MKVIPRRKRDREKRTGTMTVVEHLEELRHRIIIASIVYGSELGVMTAAKIEMPSNE